MRVIVLALLLAGCAGSQPTRVVHVVWIKDAGADVRSEKVGADNCMIRTGRERVGYAEFGAALRECLK
ncbi:MAG TPA: hypothetical protein PLT94_14645 [Rhodocyclaceae bacterium]|nr:hypothetical protein [Rhodocyclaceae bacterium]